MTHELEDYQQKVAQFSNRIKAEIAAIEVRLAAMRIIAATFEKPLLKIREAEPIDSASLKLWPPIHPLVFSDSNSPRLNLAPDCRHQRAGRASTPNAHFTSQANLR
jgi:hypothetical protein